MMHKRYHLILIICLNFVFQLSGQVFAPVTQLFPKSVYKAANQNWSATQATDGRMLFGNNNGLLQFDGSLWKTFRMPHSKLVRSLFTARDGRVYAGSFEEFGYFVRDNAGMLNYHSVSKLLKGYPMLNDEIWNILEYKGKIIFQSFTSYFVYDGTTVKGYRMGFVTMFFCGFKGQLYCHNDRMGFCLFDAELNKATPVAGTPFKSPVIAILPYNARVSIIVTKFDGLFLFDGTQFSPFKTSVDPILRKSDINRAILTKDSVIILGTIQNGVTAIDRNGISLWTLNDVHNLQNNTVLGLYCDNNNSIWVCHDVGISMIQHSAPFRLIKAFDPMIGAVYTVYYKSPWIYIGTNQGLYAGKYDPKRRQISGLQLMPQVTGQVWDISEFDGQVICSYNNGTCELSGATSKPLSSVNGGVCIRKGVINGKEVLIQGTYSTLCLYTRSANGKWEFKRIIENFVNPVRYLEIDHIGTIWVSHFHEGFYAIQLNQDLTRAESVVNFVAPDGKTAVNTGVFKLNNWIVFSDHKKFYTYDYLKKRIIPFDELNKKSSNFAGAFPLCRYSQDKYWFIRDNEAGLFRISNTSYQLTDMMTYSAFSALTVDNNQNIIPFSDNECLITLENGLATYTMNSKGMKRPDVHLNLASVIATDDEALHSLRPDIKTTSKPVLPFTRNNLLFSVYYPDFDRISNVEFRYKLDGLDKVWTRSSLSEKRYNYLPYGKYVFRAEVLSRNGHKLSQLAYSFEIAPPFYLSMWARLIYALLVIALCYFAYWYVSLRFRHKKEKILFEEEQLRKKEIEKRERQIVALEKEKLESELKLKSKELAESTMTIIKKNEMLQGIRNEIDEQKKLLGAQYPKKYYDRLIKLVDENLSSEDDWMVFQANFDRIHENFFRNLRLQYPQLTSNDLRFCAYLRLNLSSKDIAHLMNITLKGVEIGRYRIRKKLGVPSAKSLTEFMIEFR